MPIEPANLTRIMTILQRPGAPSDGVLDREEAAAALGDQAEAAHNFDHHDGAGGNDGKIDEAELSLFLAAQTQGLVIKGNDGKSYIVGADGTLQEQVTDKPPDLTAAPEGDDETRIDRIAIPENELAQRYPELFALYNLLSGKESLVTREMETALWQYGIDIQANQACIDENMTFTEFLRRSGRFVSIRNGEPSILKPHKLFRRLGINHANRKVCEAMFGNYDGKINSDDWISLDDFTTRVRDQFKDCAVTGKSFQTNITRRLAKQKCDYKTYGEHLQSMDFTSIEGSGEFIRMGRALAILDGTDPGTAIRTNYWEETAKFVFLDMQEASQARDPDTNRRVNRKFLLRGIDFENPQVLRALTTEIPDEDREGNPTSINITRTYVSSRGTPGRHALNYLRELSKNKATLPPDDQLATPDLTGNPDTPPPAPGNPVDQPPPNPAE